MSRFVVFLLYLQCNYCVFILFTCSAQKGAKKSSRFAISGPTNFTHVQHFGPYQSLNPDEMPVSTSSCT